MAAGGELEEGVVDIDQMGRSIQLLLLLLLLLGMPSLPALVALLGLCLLATMCSGACSISVC